MIDVLVPVLSRPQNAAPLVNSISAVTKVSYNIYFLCSLGDDEQIEACRQTGAEVIVVPWSADRSDYPKKMNYGLRLAGSQFILMGADDIEFMEGWDIIALRVAEDKRAAVVGTNDCANPQVKCGYFSTHAIVRRSYAEQQGASLDGPGTLVSEAYDHNYVDRELCHLAESRGLWAFAEDSKIKHRHPRWRSSREDSTYRRGRQLFREDRTLFYVRSEQWNYVGILAQERHLLEPAKKRIINIGIKQARQSSQ